MSEHPFVRVDPRVVHERSMTPQAPVRIRARRVPVLAWSVAAIAAAGTIVVACASPVESSIVLGGVADAEPPPTFTPQDAGDAEAAALPDVPMCVATECPAPFGTCSTSPYACAFDLSADPKNCGTCGNECPTFGLISMTSRCIDGECVAQCLLPRADCNRILEDGCEVDTSADAKNCGSCGNECPAGVACHGGICGCPPGFEDCAGRCIDTSTDPENCGVCGNLCDDSARPAPPTNMEYTCSGGVCGQLACSGTWKNCNGDAEDGCEIDIRRSVGPSLIDPQHCGACAKACAPDEQCHAFADGTVGCGCAEEETMCGDPWEPPYCVDLQTSAANCGACHHPCPPGRPHLAWGCTKGLCEASCELGWGDCNGNPQDGCETNLMNSGDHCGACGNACDADAGQPCVGGSCLTKPCDEDGGAAR